MGAMECDRRGCDTCMCDRISREHGYICYECFDELINSGPETNIIAFMDTHKRSNTKEEATARYNAVFSTIEY